jgi:hypothetical protein
MFIITACPVQLMLLDCACSPTFEMNSCRHDDMHCRYCNSLAFCKILASSGWDAEAAQAVSRNLSKPEHEDLGSDAHSLQPQYLTDRLYSAKYKCTVFRSTVYLPRSSHVKAVTGCIASNARLSREHAALEAIKRLHAVGELDDILRPKLDKQISSVMAAAREDWLSTRSAGDRVAEEHWQTLQTWRKPPVMCLPQNSSVALDHRANAGSRLSAAGIGHPAVQKECPHAAVTLDSTGACTHGANSAPEAHSNTTLQVATQQYWLYSFQLNTVKRADNGSGAS